MKKKSKKMLMYIIYAVLIIAIAILGYKLYQKNNESVIASENLYNQSLNELIYYMENVENYLAKSTISTSAKYGAETLTHLWREANLAQTYLSMLPIQSQELENTEKFLNQISDYSYSLSRKNINGENLSEDDLNNLKDLYKYCDELNNVISQINSDLNSENIKWSDLTGDGTVDYAQQVSSNLDVITAMEDNFHEYSGLIYDGAYSEHITSVEKKGLTGNDLSEEETTNIVKQFIGEDNINEISNLGFSENATVPSYTYTVKTKNDGDVTIAISKKGGHIVYLNTNRKVEVENLNFDQANEKGKEFLKQKNIENMEQTYYLKNDGIITINYAYSQDGVIMYPDLIKLKIALDNGQILGMETSGYLNNHTIRDISGAKISKEDAKKNLNKNLDIQSEKLAVIPTEWKTEILCYEFKGKIEDKEYLVYINASTGEEQDILIITNTPNGVLTM